MIVHSDKYKRGFTLIELVIVVSVIAVLSGVSIFAMREARTSGRNAKRQADLAQIASGLELYKADCNFYPNALPAVNDPLSGDTDPCTLPATNVYIQAMPSDPDGSAYVYTPRPVDCHTSDNCRQFCVWTLLETTGPATIPAPAFCMSVCAPLPSCGGVPCNFCVTNP